LNVDGKVLFTSKWSEEIVTELNISFVEEDDFSTICDYKVQEEDYSKPALEVRDSDFDAKSIFEMDYEEEDLQAHTIDFFACLRESLNYKDQGFQEERKVDMLSECLARLVKFNRRPFRLTAEKLHFTVGGTTITSESDLLVIQLEDNLIMLIFEDKHRKNYKGKNGLWQIAGEMVGGLLFNLNTLVKEKEKEDQEKVVEEDVVDDDNRMYAIRLSSDEVTFFQTELSSEQLLALRHGDIPKPVIIHSYPKAEHGKHGLALGKPDEREKALEYLLAIAKDLEPVE